MPTIFLYHLASLTSLRKAPNGSIKRADPEGMMFHISSNPTSGVFWPAHFYGTGVLRPIDSEQANFRVARHPTTIRRSCCRELDARVEPLVFHQLIYTAVCANVSVLCMHSGAFCIAREPLGV